MRLPVNRVPCRIGAHGTVARRHRVRQLSGFAPTTKGGGLAPFERRLGVDFLELMATNPEVESISVRPETYAWRDGIDGRRHSYTPDFLAVRSNGSRVYRSVMSHARMLRDPDLSARRARIELECAARGGTFEIWTEREVRVATCGSLLLRVASLAEADELEKVRRDEGAFGGRDVPSFVARVAKEMALSQPRRVGEAFLARSVLTGILMAVLSNLRTDPSSGALIWDPSPHLS